MNLLSSLAQGKTLLKKERRGEGVRLAEIGDLLQRAAKSKGEFDHGGKCLQETIQKCCASTGLDCFGAVIKRAGKNPE